MQRNRIRRVARQVPLSALFGMYLADSAWAQREYQPGNFRLIRGENRTACSVNHPVDYAIESFDGKVIMVSNRGYIPRSTLEKRCAKDKETTVNFTPSRVGILVDVISSVGTRNRVVSRRSGHPCGCAQPHGRARSPAIRPYPLSSASPRSPCFQSRFMQQRPWRRNTELEPVFDSTGNPVLLPNGHPKKKHYATTHTIALTEEVQEP